MDAFSAALTSGTSVEAKAEAVRWMDIYRQTSAYKWEWQTATTLECEPLPRFPCYVMALATPGKSGGYRPSLAFTAGTKHRGRYWQGLIPDGDHTGLSPETLVRLDAVLGVLTTASQLPLPLPR